MRASLSLLALLGLLAACTGPQQISASPPSVSYRVAGADVSQANLSAAQYCRQYGLVPQLEGVAPSGGGSVASYTCRAASTP